MTNPIIMRPVDMDREIMLRLEDLGLVHRLAPGRDVAGPVNGTNLDRSIYEADIQYGGHKLIVATVGATDLQSFGYHLDCEDVFLIGRDDWQPLHFVIATCLADEFTAKAAAGRLTASDLVCLRVRYNDPEASFFVMNKLVPHGEFVLPGAGEAPSFYVTESVDLEVLPLGFGPHAVEVAHGDATVRLTPPPPGGTA